MEKLSPLALKRIEAVRAEVQQKFEEIILSQKITDLVPPPYLLVGILDKVSVNYQTMTYYMPFEIIIPANKTRLKKPLVLLDAISLHHDKRFEIPHQIRQKMTKKLEHLVKILPFVINRADHLGEISVTTAVG